PGRERGRAQEHQEEAGRDDLGDQQYDTADQPQPAGIDAVHSAALGTLGTAFALGAVAPPLRPPTASLASSAMPPSVPISCVASTGNRMVLALGERANSLIASTYFWAMK